MAQAIIVGAGIIGSAIALELERRGIHCQLLERAVPGAESSSAAAGMLAPQLEAHADDPAFALGLWSRALYPAWIEALEAASGLEVGYARDGGVALYATAEEAARASESAAWQRARGLRVEALDEEALRGALPGLGEAYRAGLFFPDEAQVDPRRLMAALAAATRAAGATHHTGAVVERLLVRGERVTGVQVRGGVLEADAVILAAGAWSCRIEGAALPSGAVEPARGQMLCLDAGRPPFGPFVWSGRGYLVPRRDGRVLVGATVERAGYEKVVTAGGIAGLLGAALDAFPGLSGAPLLETWAGLRPWTADGAPILGAAARGGLFYATGHHRNGILQAPATARLIAALITGESPELDLAPFSAARFGAST